ncbi:MAG TPA: hypothetical protein VJ719_08920 [Chthoniobacterales bacterium]|nr:hypothetical protein [Chthoniobacterales bacterium]
MRREWVAKRFPVLLPLAVAWARRQERRILRNGVPLTDSEMEDARAVGVRQPDRVRLLPVKIVPWPGAATLRSAAKAVGFATDATCGLTLGYGIFIREDYWRDRALVAHELVHIAQYERLGGVGPFLRQYLGECLTVGYVNAPLEREATTLAQSRISIA